MYQDSTFANIGQVDLQRKQNAATERAQLNKMF